MLFFLKLFHLFLKKLSQKGQMWPVCTGGVFGTRAKGKKEENSVCVLFVNAKKPTNTIKSRSETATAIRPHVPVTSTIGVSLTLPCLTRSGVSARTRLVVSWSVTCLLLHNSLSLSLSLSLCVCVRVCVCVSHLSCLLKRKEKRYGCQR